jgi:hypothetical protein
VSAAPRGSFEWRAKRPGTLTPEQLRTARKVQAIYAQLSNGGLRSPRLVRKSMGHGTEGPAEAMLAAREDLQRVVDTIGRAGEARLRAHLVDGATIADLCARYGYEPRQMVAVIHADLDALANVVSPAAVV